MADNTLQNATDNIATDELSTLNSVDVSAASPRIKVQRTKIQYGDDGVARDVSTAFPLPILDADTTGSGTITSTDAVVGAPAGAGALVSGSSTAGSLVSAACPGGDSAWNCQITGLTTGTLYFEESLDSTNGTNGNWINVNGRQTGIVNTVLSGNATTNGVFRGNTSGAAYWRIRSVGTLTGTPAIVVRFSSGPGAVFLNASVPTGSNTIGATLPATYSTGTRTAINATVTEGILLAANTNRKYATILNDATAHLFVGLGTTVASATDHTTRLMRWDYFEVPLGFVGQVRGVWQSASGDGGARITELT